MNALAGQIMTATLSTASTDTTLNSQSILEFREWRVSDLDDIRQRADHDHGTAGVNAVLMQVCSSLANAAPVILSTAAVSAAGASGGTGNGSSVQERVATTQIEFCRQRSKNPLTSDQFGALLDAVLSSGPIASLNDEAGTDHSHNGSVTTFPQVLNVPALELTSYSRRGPGTGLRQAQAAAVFQPGRFPASARG